MKAVELLLLGVLVAVLFGEARYNVVQGGDALLQASYGVLWMSGIAITVLGNNLGRQLLMSALFTKGLGVPSLTLFLARSSPADIKNLLVSSGFGLCYIAIAGFLFAVGEHDKNIAAKK